MEKRGLSEAAPTWGSRWGLVPTSGVEPPWGCPHLILSQARLPFRHVGTEVAFHRRASFA